MVDVSVSMSPIPIMRFSLGTRHFALPASEKPKNGLGFWHIGVSKNEILFLFLKPKRCMVVISKTIIVDFGKEHADSMDALNDWWRIVKKRNWESLQDIKKDFGSVDYVGNDRYVFNIKGNKYRLVGMIFFDIRTVFYTLYRNACGLQ